MRTFREGRTEGGKLLWVWLCSLITDWCCYIEVHNADSIKITCAYTHAPWEDDDSQDKVGIKVMNVVRCCVCDLLTNGIMDALCWMQQYSTIILSKSQSRYRTVLWAQSLLCGHSPCCFLLTGCFCQRRKFIQKAKPVSLGACFFYIIASVASKSITASYLFTTKAKP